MNIDLPAMGPRGSITVFVPKDPIITRGRAGNRLMGQLSSSRHKPRCSLEYIPGSTKTQRIRGEMTEPAGDEANQSASA
jgi:hypothetical protein